MRLKRAVILIVILSACTTVFCQSAQYRDSLNSEYQTRYIELNKYYTKHPDDIPTLALLAKFYSDSLNPLYNLPIAMERVNDAEERYVALVNSDDTYKEMRRLLKLNITLSTIRQLKSNITKQAQERIEKENITLSDVELSRYESLFNNNEEIGKELRRQRMERTFSEVKKRNTMDGYYEFWRQYRGTTVADSAEESLRRLSRRRFELLENEEDINEIAQRYPESEVVQYEAMQRKSRIAYTVACTQHTVEGYRAFLKTYPSSDEYLSALDRMEELLETQYEALCTASTYAQFVINNNDNDLANEALTTLCEKIKKDKDVEAAKIYLSTFPLDENYNDIFRLYYDWHAAEGNLQPIAEFAKQYPNYPFQMALKADIKEGKSIDSLKLMQPYNETKREQYISYIRKHTGKRIVFAALQRLIQPYVAKKDWKGAVDQMEWVCLSFDTECKKEYEELKSILQTVPDAKTSLEQEVCPVYSIQNACPTDDGQEIYYTRYDSKGSSIWVAEVDNSKKPRWRARGAITFSNAENKNMSIYSLYDRGDKMLIGKDGDIWIAQREGDSWRITDIPPYPVNTDHYEGDAYMIPDGTGMLLVSDRPGGYNLQASGAYYHGDTAKATDIYFIPNTMNGWGEPINLGSNINTTYCEKSPILSRDLKTLYFISDGRSGLGYGDILISTRTNADNWTQWTKPKNLGREANSCLDEGTISFSNDEQRLYICSRRQGALYGLYSCGTIHNGTDYRRKINIHATNIGGQLNSINITDMTHHALSRQITYPDADKEITVDLYLGKRYLLYGKATGLYVPVVLIEPQKTHNVTLQGYTAEQLIKKGTLPLTSITFLTDKPEITTLSKKELDILSEYLYDNREIAIDIIVNTPGAKAQACYELSIARGQTIRRYLISQGVEPTRISVSGYGNINYRGNRVRPATEVQIRFSK